MPRPPKVTAETLPDTLRRWAALLDRELKRGDRLYVINAAHFMNSIFDGMLRDAGVFSAERQCDPRGDPRK